MLSGGERMAAEVVTRAFWNRGKGPEKLGPRQLNSGQKQVFTGSCPTTLATAVRVRRFNRFYTRRLGLLNAGLLQGPFSLAEVRVLYEVSHLGYPTAKEIADALDLDLSRLLQGLRHRGLLKARAPAGDRRQR
jgi:hypothetical protein